MPYSYTNRFSEDEVKKGARFKNRHGETLMIGQYAQFGSAEDFSIVWLTGRFMGWITPEVPRRQIFSQLHQQDFLLEVEV